MKALAKKIAKSAAILSLVVCLALAAFATYWAGVYRLPRSQPVVVDLRRDKTAENSAGDRCFLICAGLANNPHGFPGHCYIVWDRCTPEWLEYAQSDGFVPARLVDLIPSLYSNISGIMADHAVVGNMRNFDYITVKLDQMPYDKARSVRAHFVTNTTFRTGVRDCVAYVDEIAEVVGLKTPPRSFVYPLDYMVRIKALNTKPECALLKEP